MTKEIGMGLVMDASMPNMEAWFEWITDKEPPTKPSELLDNAREILGVVGKTEGVYQDLDGCVCLMTALLAGAYPNEIIPTEPLDLFDIVWNKALHDNKVFDKTQHSLAYFITAEEELPHAASLSGWSDTKSVFEVMEMLRKAADKAKEWGQ